MGLFMMMSGVANSSRSAVETALREFATSQGGTLEAIDSSDNSFKAVLIAESGKHVVVIYPSDFMQWDEASEYLSRTLSTSVFSFHIHDGDLWMYALYFRGTKIDQFNPIPAYWDDGIADNERRSWAGNADAVCRHWPEVTPEAIREYFACWNLLEMAPGKAYADDEFSFNDCWQVTDFMRRVGLV